MKILLVADSYGSTPQLLQFAAELEGEVSIVTAEDRAKSNKTITESLNTTRKYKQYANKVASKIRHIAPQLVIGFGVGGSAAWRALLQLEGADNLQQLIAFYPSHSLEIPASQLACPVTIYFAQHEFDFDVTPIVTMLNSKKSVSCIRTRYQHGFMEPLSGQYDPCAYRHYLGLCQQEVMEVSPVMEEALCN